MKMAIAALLLSFDLGTSVFAQVNDGILMKVNTEYQPRIASFEQTYGINFSAAVTLELLAIKKKNQGRDLLEADMARAYNSVLASEYGRIYFVSQPKSGSIFVNGEEQKPKTNAVLGFKIGRYSCKIVTFKKTCEQNLEVESKKVVEMRCP